MLALVEGACCTKIRRTLQLGFVCSLHMLLMQARSHLDAVMSVIVVSMFTDDSMCGIFLGFTEGAQTFNAWSMLSISKETPSRAVACLQ